jgi:hypothetical protein
VLNTNRITHGKDPRTSAVKGLAAGMSTPEVKTKFWRNYLNGSRIHETASEAGVHCRSSAPAAGTPKWGPISTLSAMASISCDLHKTVKKLEESSTHYVRELSETHGRASSSWAPRSRPRKAIREEATRCGMYFVNAAGWAVCSQLQDHARPRGPSQPA